MPVVFKVNIVYQIYDVPTFYFCIAEGEKSIEVLVEQGSILDYDAKVRYCLIIFFYVSYVIVFYFIAIVRNISLILLNDTFLSRHSRVTLDLGHKFPCQ